MINRLLLVFLLLTIETFADPPTDILVKNENVLTMGDREPRARAFAVKDRRLTVVGENEHIAALAGPATRVFVLAGKTVRRGLCASVFLLVCAVSQHALVAAVG